MFVFAVVLCGPTSTDLYVVVIFDFVVVAIVAVVQTACDSVVIIVVVRAAEIY